MGQGNGHLWADAIKQRGEGSSQPLFNATGPVPSQAQYKRREIEMMTKAEIKAYQTQEQTRLAFLDGTGTREEWHQACKEYQAFGIEKGRKMMQEQIDNGMDTSQFN